MNIKGKGVLLAVSALGLILAGAGPALAQHGGGGGGGGHGGGGHASGGGGHGAVGHAGGGAHFAGPGHFSGGGRVAMGFHGGGPAGFHGGAFSGHGAGFAGHGFSTGWRGGSFGGGWRGGWWRGGFWPRAFYGGGFAWFLPILPLAYATYWYGGVPYYYADDVYYTWNPSYDGYVATDPPPVGDSSGSADVSGSGPAPSGDVGAQNPGPGPGGPVPGQIFMYPKNGQSAEQQASDKAECQRWASEQAGQVAQNGSDYNRAMVACVEGRGYSAR
jgi:hypothetical protein